MLAQQHTHTLWRRNCHRTPLSLSKVLRFNNPAAAVAPTATIKSTSSSLVRTFTKTITTTTAPTTSTSRPMYPSSLGGRFVGWKNDPIAAAAGGGAGGGFSTTNLRWLSSGSSSRGGGRGGSSKNNKNNNTTTTTSFRPRRMPGKEYLRLVQGPKLLKNKGTNKKIASSGSTIKGPKDPNNVSTSVPRIDMSQIRITDIDDDDDQDGPTKILRDDEMISTFGPLMGGTIRMLRAKAMAMASASAATSSSSSAPGPAVLGDDVEANLRMMDFFTSPQGSTEDLVGSRRAVSLEALPDEDVPSILQEMDRLVEEERVLYMDLPPTDVVSPSDIRKEENKGSNQIPKTQLAHGDWYVLCCNHRYVYIYIYIYIYCTAYIYIHRIRA
jgi:hypothetical protein